MNDSPGPLVTRDVHELLIAARAAGASSVQCSVDLGRGTTTVSVGSQGWECDGRSYPYMSACRDRTVYYWTVDGFQPVARFTTALTKLVPTPWGAPTFEIDGIKMLPTARVSPYEDAAAKVSLIEPRGKHILDTCGGLGYFAAQCLRGRAAHVQSWEKSPDVLWLRSLNPWSPDSRWAAERPAGLTLTCADILQSIAALPSASFDAILHDPPRFAIAGELYSQDFYGQLARLLRPQGRLFHYTGAPNSLSRGRRLCVEVIGRLQRVGLAAESAADGVLAIRTPAR